MEPMHTEKNNQEMGSRKITVKLSAAESILLTKKCVKPATNFYNYVRIIISN